MGTNASAVRYRDFNHWDATLNVLHLRNDDSGIWEDLLLMSRRATYKYRIVSRDGK